MMVDHASFDRYMFDHTRPATIDELESFRADEWNMDRFDFRVELTDDAFPARYAIAKRTS